MSKNSRQKFEYLENKKTFKVKQKAFFINFKELSVARNSLRPETVPLTPQAGRSNAIIPTVLPQEIYTLE